MTSADLEARVQALAARPYPTRLSGNPEDGYLVEVPDLPGCMTAAMDPFEALARVREAIEAWVEDALESGEDAYQHLVQRAQRLGLSPEQAMTVMVEGRSAISDLVPVGPESESGRIRQIKGIDQVMTPGTRSGVTSAENEAAPRARPEN